MDKCTLYNKINKSQTEDLDLEASCLPEGAINEAQRQRRVMNVFVWNNRVLQRFTEVYTISKSVKRGELPAIDGLVLP